MGKVHNMYCSLLFTRIYVRFHINNKTPIASMFCSNTRARDVSLQQRGFTMKPFVLTALGKHTRIYEIH